MTFRAGRRVNQGAGAPRNAFFGAAGIYDMRDKIVNVVLRHYPQAQGIYLFGSCVAGDSESGRDVDIALLLSPERAAEEKSLDMSPCAIALERALSKDVDLLNARLVSTVFQKEIIGGTLLYEGDSYAVAEFEMLVVSLYQKLNEERREILEDFLGAGRAYLE